MLLTTDIARIIIPEMKSFIHKYGTKILVIQLTLSYKVLKPNAACFEAIRIADKAYDFFNDFDFFNAKFLEINKTEKSSCVNGSDNHV